MAKLIPSVTGLQGVEEPRRSCRQRNGVHRGPLTVLGVHDSHRAPPFASARFLVSIPNLPKSKQKIHLDKGESRVRSREEPPRNIPNSGAALRA